MSVDLKALAKAVTTLDEVRVWHRDSTSREYNECEKPDNECMWCESASAAAVAIGQAVDEIRELRALQARVEGAPVGWLTMDSAPRDGKMFLGWVSAERWSQEDGGGSGRSYDTSDVDFCQWRDNDGNGYFDNMMGQIGDMQDITHWQPLPEPPTLDGQRVALVGREPES